MHKTFLIDSQSTITDNNFYYYIDIILKLTILFPTCIITLAFFFAVDVPPVVNGLASGSMTNSTSNVTLPQIDANNNKNNDQDRKIQSCQMPPCPPGEMCIQVCPESIPPP
jgi:hypothetical protein